MDMTNDLLKKIKEEDSKQIKILEQLDRVKQPYKLLLEKVYIQGKNLLEASEEMNYTYEYVRKMNVLALNEFDKVNKKI